MLGSVISITRSRGISLNTLHRRLEVREYREALSRLVSRGYKVDGPHGRKNLCIEGFLSIADVETNHRPPWLKQFCPDQSHRLSVGSSMAPSGSPEAVAGRTLGAWWFPSWKKARALATSPFSSLNPSVHTVPSKAPTASTASILLLPSFGAATIFPGKRAPPPRPTSSNEFESAGYTWSGIFSPSKHLRVLCVLVLAPVFGPNWKVQLEN